MFDQLFTRQHAIERHLASPLSEERLRYLQHCSAQGGTRCFLRSLAQSMLVIIDILDLATVVGEIDIAKIEAAADRWIYRQPRHFNRTRDRAGRDLLISRATQWLHFLGRLRLPTVTLPPYVHLSQEFADYMRLERGLSEHTIETRLFYVNDFLDWFCKDGRSLSEITITHIDEAIARKGREQGYSRLSVQVFTSALRTFFRYAETRKWCSPGLTVLIASPRVYQDETLPTGPAWEDVQRLIATTEGDHPKDIRDRAILMLLAVYGLRSGEVRALKLGDFDWEKNLVYVTRPKLRQKQPYPLSPTVGEAILRYLQEVRPRSSYREVFLTVDSPIHPLRGSSLWTMVAKRLRPLGLPLKHQGPHSLRHACATHLLAQGLSLKEIGDHLGHRLPRTTHLYAKVHLPGLREVADFNLGGLL
jgi:integrase/recombinase XerD